MASLAIMIMITVLGCKSTTNTSASNTAYLQPVAVSNDKGAPTVGIAINIDGALWHAASYEIQRMGIFWVVKGLGADNSAFSIMLPDPLATAAHTVSQGGPVSVTYSKAPGKGPTYLAPYSENNGWVNTTLADGYLRGSLEVTLNSGGDLKKCMGTFSIKLE